MAEAESFPAEGAAFIFASDGNIRTLHQIEGDIFRLAVANYGGCVTRVARHLGIGRTTVYRKLDQFGIRCINCM
jgi:transcriptional regulator of acetoin/glycerol metabolism